MTNAAVLRDSENGIVYVRLYDSRDTATAGSLPYFDIVLQQIAWNPDIMRQLAATAISSAGIQTPKDIVVPPEYVLKKWTAGESHFKPEARR